MLSSKKAPGYLLKRRATNRSTITSRKKLTSRRDTIYITSSATNAYDFSLLCEENGKMAQFNQPTNQQKNPI